MIFDRRYLILWLAAAIGAVISLGSLSVTRVDAHGHASRHGRKAQGNGTTAERGRHRHITASRAKRPAASAGSAAPGERVSATRRPAGVGSAPTPSAPRLVWSDDFNGPAGSTPDPRKWSVAAGWGGGTSELEYYSADPRNVSLDGRGDLAVTARQQLTAAGGRVYPFTSGRLQTKGLFQTEYGSLQARIELPQGNGLWPAFWAVGSDIDQVGWPACGEIDMMENRGNDPYSILGSVHGPRAGQPAGYGVSNVERSPTSLAAAFHTYGVNWSPTAIQFTLDGQVYATETPASLGNKPWVFNKPFYMILNLAVASDDIGSLTSFNQFPATMLVDWVRVYS